MADDSMPEVRRETEALRADTVALAEVCSPARFRQRAGAFGLSPGVAMDLRLGWDLGLQADQYLLTKPDKFGRNAGAGQTSLGVCMRSGRVTDRARWTRSLRAFLGGDIVE